MSDRLKAWIHWKKKAGLGEDDALLIHDIEELQKENASVVEKLRGVKGE